MPRHTKYLLFFILNISLFSQTLYWKGNSGKFSDLSNWVDEKGLTPAFAPNENTHVVFKRSFHEYTVDIDKPLRLKSWTSEPNAKYNVIGPGMNDIVLSGNFILSPYVKWNALGDILIKSGELSKEIIINTGNNPLNSKIKISDAFVTIEQLYTNKNLEFERSRIKLHHSTVNSRVLKTDAFSEFELNNSLVKIEKEILFYSSKIKYENSLVITDIDNKQKSVIPESPGSTLFKFTNPDVIMCAVTVSSVLPTCPNTCDGKISFTLSGACSSGPYTISYPGWPVSCSPVPTLTSVGNGPVSFTISNLCKCGSNYNVAILDNSSNVVGVYQISMVMSDFDFLPLVMNPPNCPGQCNGSFSGIITGGTSPYSATLLPVGTTSTNVTALNYTNLCASPPVYTIQISDSKGCTYSETLNLPSPVPLQTNPTFSNITCNGACNGFFIINPTGGTPSYTVNFSNGSTVSVGAGGSASITGLCPGPYSATLTDSKGCNTTTNVNLTQPPAVTLNVNTASATCNGTCNGSATVTASGGVPPFTFTWLPSGSSGSVITSLCQGNYTIQSTDNNGCLVQQTFNILAPPAITLNVSQKNITCNAQCNGSLGAQASGGTGAITFTWTGPSFGPSNSPSITNLCPGVYTLQLKDANNCTQTHTYNLTQPPPLSITANVFSVNCFGACNGSAIVNPSGGNGPPFSYTWSPNPPSGQGTATISNLCPGSFTVTVHDASACPVSTQVTITQPASITPNITSGSLACNGVCTGSINSTPSGGNGPYSFSLVTPFGSTLTTNPPYTGLCAGLYTLIILDNTGCVRTQTVNITQPNPLIAGFSTSSVTCFGQCNGVLTGNASGGTPAYSFTWTSGSSSVASSFSSNVCAGTYTLFVKDNNGCLASTVATINQPPDINATLNITPPTCNSGCNGQISALVSGGTPSYTFNWSNGATTAINPNLCAGNYTLTITDQNGCQKQFTASITAPPPMTIQVQTSSVSCFGQCNGSATVNVTGGTPNFTYQFNTVPVTTNTTGIITGLCSGNFIVQVTDGQNCSQNQNFTIGSPPAITINPTGVLPACSACTGAGTVNVSGGTPGYTVVWTSSLGPVGSGTTASGLCTGPHTITANDQNGCTATTTLNVGQTVSVTVSAAGSTTLNCFGLCNGTAIANASGGLPPYTYTWSTIPVQNTSLAVNLCAGNYTVTVQDQNGCQNSATIAFTQPPQLSVTVNHTNVTCFGQCNGIAQASVTGGTPAYNYTWLPGNQSTSIISSQCAGTYTVLVTDSKGCSGTRTVQIVQPSSISVVVTATNPTGCNVNNGQLCASASGGNPGYTYTWTPAGSGGPNNPCNTGLGAGNYSLIVQDQAGCTFTTSSSLTTPAGPTLTIINVNPVTCFGFNNGNAQAVATGGGPFTFTWSPSTASSVVGATTTATGLNSGTYIISVTGANGCVTSSQVVITQPASISIQGTVSNVKCFGQNNGSVVANVSGGTPGYTLNWTPAPGGGQGTQTVTGLSQGNYTLQVTDNNGCNSASVFVVNQPSSLTIASSQTNALCNGSCNAAISVTASGGSPAYSFSWLPVGSFPGSAFPNLNLICPNSYTLNVTDANNCTTSLVVNITQPPALNAVLQTASVQCASNCNGSASVGVSGGTPSYTFAWSGSTVTTSTIGGLCPGTYTSIVTDQNGCQAITPFTINAPPAIQASITPFNPICNAQCNGSITTNVSGGVGPYTYSWVPSGNTPTLTNACAGAYTVIISDANNCTIALATNLVDPPAINPNLTFTNPLCGGLCNGAAQANPSNATPPISYTWSTVPPQNTQGVSNLCPGNYTLIIQDFKGCVDVSTISISSPPALSINPALAPASCSLANGAITVVPSGGTPAYSFTWVPSSLGNNSVVTGLSAGVYTVIVNDQNGCANSSVIALSNANGPSSAVISSQSVTCFGACNGSANVTSVSGGQAPYSISWVSPPAPSTTNPISGLCPGNYIAQITDNNNCTLFQNITIQQPTQIQDNGVVFSPLCTGVCNGTIQPNPSGGTGSYTYSWSTGATSSLLTNVCTGNYTLIITDANSCTIASVYSVSGTQSISSTALTSSNNCFNTCTASSTITAIGGGAPPYSIVWSNSQVGPISTNLCNGNYTATIIDQNGCQKQHTIQVQSPPAITSNFSVSSPSCGLCNGSGTVTAAGGSGGFTYTWSSGPNTNTASNLCPGIYNVLISDANGCLKTETLIISNSNGITGENIQTQNPNCAGVCNGAATVSPIGGTAPYTYSWVSPPSTNSVVSGLCQGNYYLQITDAQGCVRTVSLSIQTPNPIVITPTILPPSCGNNNGTLIAGATGGSGGPYSYTWFPGSVTSGTLTSVTPGLYTLTVSDGACQQSTVLTVNGSNAPVLSFTQQNIPCSGSCNGAVTVQPIGGIPPYNFSWSNGANTSTVNNLCSGIANVMVVDGNGCQAYQQFTITSNPPLVFSLPDINPVQCHNDCNGSIQVVPSGGVLPYTYTWNPPATVTPQNPNTGLCAGNYTVTITDGAGCQASQTFQLVNPPAISLSVNSNSSTCNSVADASITTTVSGGVPSYTFVWIGPSGTLTTQSPSNILSGTYTLTLTDQSACVINTVINVGTNLNVVANAGNDTTYCYNPVAINLTGTLSQNAVNYTWLSIPSNNTLATTPNTTVIPASGSNTYVLLVSSTNTACFDYDTVIVNQLPLPVVDAGPTYSIPLYGSVTIGGNPTSAAGNTFTWIPATGLSDVNNPNPVSNTTITTVYTVVVTGTNGCVAYDTTLVFVYPEIKIPNGFSPNGDGVNDTWIIDNLEQFPDNEVEIYNRWGELLFRSVGYRTPFDGKYRGKDLPVGTYYYVLKLNHPAYPEPYTGPLTIFR